MITIFFNVFFLSFKGFLFNNNSYFGLLKHTYKNANLLAMAIKLGVAQFNYFIIINKTVIIWATLSSFSFRL
jgi:hypothetical protein